MQRGTACAHCRLHVTQRKTVMSVSIDFERQFTSLE
jgi:hypothetical protein